MISIMIKKTRIIKEKRSIIFICKKSGYLGSSNASGVCWNASNSKYQQKSMRKHKRHIALLAEKN